MQLETQKKNLEDEKSQLEVKKTQIQEKEKQILEKLERASRLSEQEAKNEVLKHWEHKLTGEVAKRIRSAEEEIRIKADEKAREILVDAMRFGAVDYVAEYTLSTVTLQSDEYKGRIIGKEGRNIRTFELATGVDVDLEEEGVIKLSSFDAVRREVARVSMEKLIKDGRIQPERIEEIVKKSGGIK